MLNITEKSEGEAAKDYVLRQLIYNIVHTNLLPGQKLEAPELCSLMNVSNNPLREAELELAQSKLIEIKPKIGAFVSYVNSDIVEQLRDLRCVLEAQLAVEACDILTKNQLDSLYENVAGKCISNAVMKKRFSHLIKNFMEACIKYVAKLYGTTL